MWRYLLLGAGVSLPIAALTMYAGQTPKTAKALPAIDQAAPEKIETATFALG